MRGEAEWRQNLRFLESITRQKPEWVAQGVGYLQIVLVNVCFVGNPEADPVEWVLVDAGLPNHSLDIITAGDDLFGKNTPPKAIILTEGHFDHVGSVVDLANRWNVTVYAHSLELPYLTGQAQYPAPDPNVSAGLLVKMSPMFPKHPVNLGTRVQSLPEDGSVPWMPGWYCLHTPGRTQGNIALFREEDRVLIAGDTFTTVKQESGETVEKQITEVQGPPAYLTTDWAAAWESVKKLAALNPEVAITGHGRPMKGEELRKQLSELAEKFDELALPDHGRYVQQSFKPQA